jgi:hypothetical protein
MRNRPPVISVQFPFGFRLLNQRGKISVMPVGRRLFTVNIVEEAARDFLLTEIFQNTEIASLVMIDRMTRTRNIRAGAEFLCVSHFVISSGAFPDSL